MPGRLAEAPAAQQLALHLDHRVPGAQGQPEGHQGLGRPGQARRVGDHPQPEDLGRRALELPGRLGLRAASSPAATTPRRKDFVATLFTNVPVLDSRRARLDHHLRRARHRRRAAHLGERGPPVAQGIRRRQVRDRLPAARASWPSRRWRWSTRWSTRRARASWPRPTCEYLYTAEGQEIAAKHNLRPRRRQGAGQVRQALPEGQHLHHRRGLRRLDQGAEGALRRRRRSSTRSSPRRSAALSAAPATAMILSPHAAQAPQRAARLRPGARLHAAVPQPDRADPAVGGVPEDLHA